MDGCDLVGCTHSITSLSELPLPRGDHSTVVVAPPEDRPGFWAGAPSAVSVDGTTYLAYRLRRPVGQGRGYAIVVARSNDGERFETLATLRSEEFGAESLERPVLAITPDGVWRLYVSCATPGTKHWRVELLEADDPRSFRAADARLVVPGDEHFGVKDPVVLWHDGSWHMWACFHPLESPDDADRMQTRHATSPDGIDWQWDGTCLVGAPGGWDARGVRFTSVLFRSGDAVAYYDGRASRHENYEERTGVAVSPDGIRFHRVADRPVAASPHPGGGLRYLTLLPQGGGRFRLYYEYTRADGAHELRTELADVPSVEPVTRTISAVLPRLPRQVPASR